MIDEPPLHPRASPAPSFAWPVILLAVVSSVVTSTVMFMGLNHFANPSAESKAATMIDGLKVATEDGTHGGAANGGAPAETETDAATPAGAGAASVLRIIKVLRESGKDFVSPMTHGMLNKDLGALESAANKVAKDPGGDTDRSGKLVGAFAAALDKTISQADQISQRSGETAATVELSNQLKDSLGQVRGTLPQ